METVNNTLEERGKVYGDYKGGIEFRTSMKHLIYARFKEVRGRDMTITEQEYFSDTIMKLSRLAVSPTHVDSWHDLAGYAILMEEALDDNSK